MSYLIKSPYDNEWAVSQPFAHTDSKYRFDKNQLRFGKKWVWYDRPVSYNFNQYGYRMDKELDEVDFDNYIAFFGCSFSVGIGLPIEETYAFRISKTLGTDYLNASMGGASCDFVFHNIVELLSSSVKKPKAIIINWPEITRTFYWVDNKMEFHLANAPTTTDHWTRAYAAFLMEDSQINNRFKFMRTVVKLLCQLSDVRLYEFTTHQSDAEKFFVDYPEIKQIYLMPQDSVEDKATVEFINKYCARDIDLVTTKYGNGSHPGIYFQNAVENEIVKWYNND